jgi:hypothetical protein
VSTTEVTDLIAAMRSGAMSLEEVADCFRQRSWKRTRHAEPQSYLELATLAESDRHMIAENSHGSSTESLLGRSPTR